LNFRPFGVVEDAALENMTLGHLHLPVEFHKKLLID
jgi:hypothetical protein